MKLRVILTVCAMALATVGAVGASPASASSASDVSHQRCTGSGTTTLDVGIGFPPAGTRANVGFKITVTCLPGSTVPSVTATGTLSTASCGLSSGSGALSTGETFSIQTAGGTFVLTGQVTGGGQVVADPTISNNSCTNNTARFFRTTGAITW